MFTAPTSRSGILSARASVSTAGRRPPERMRTSMPSPRSAYLIACGRDEREAAAVDVFEPYQAAHGLLRETLALFADRTSEEINAFDAGEGGIAVEDDAADGRHDVTMPGVGAAGKRSPEATASRSRRATRAGSVLRYARIHVIAPAADATGEVPHARESGILKLLHRARTS